MTDKKQWLAAFLKFLESEIQLLKTAAIATYDAATNEESKPENQYDTRALEASYLAGAQAKRVNEIEVVIQLFHTLNFKNFSAHEAIALTALVELKVDGKRGRFLVMPNGGGISCEIAHETTQIVTPSSAMGEAIMGLEVGDVAEFEIGQRVRLCEILSVI